MTDAGEQHDLHAGQAVGGFTIIEVVVASLILVLGITAIFTAMTTAIRSQYMANNFYHATCIARNRVQRGLALPFESLPVLQEDKRPVDQDGNVNVSGPFERTTTLTKLTDNCYKIHVDVYYPIGSGRMSAEPVTVESMVARDMYREDFTK